MVVATVDELVSTEEVAAAGVTIPGHLVAAVTEVPFGAHPTSCYPRYAYDRDAPARVRVRGPVGPRRTWTSTWPPTSTAREEGYREAVGAGRLAALASWPESTAVWQELFA